VLIKKEVLMNKIIKQKCIFKGVATALVTPFSEGKIDYPSLFSLIENQIENKIPALVLCGTTGESPTITEKERESLICAVSEHIDGRATLIMGVGTNDTESSVRFTKFASSHGADALLAVTPYYNKGTKNGLVEHFKKVAGETDLPIIVYNVPSRTGVDISISQMERLAHVNNIVAIKEASPSIEKAELFVRTFKDRFALYSGNDSLTLPILAIGGKGVISVVSNVLPREMNELCASFFKGRIKKSRELQLRLLPFINTLFEETNPAPAKYALSLLNVCKNELRLPLSPIQYPLTDKIKRELFEIIETGE
jgi:4-hydroxy-tetrahydrodipicolinate synthase